MINGVKNVVAVLEYIAWLLPIGFVAVGRYKITSENGKSSGILNVIASLILAGVSISVKEFLILNSSLQFEESTLIGNSLILISYIFLFIAVRQVDREIEGLIKIPNRMFTYSALLFLFPFYALLKKDYFISIDLFVYSFLIIITVTCVGTLYLLTKEKRKYLSPLISLFAISLLADFLFKGVSEVFSLDIIQNLKLLTFSFRSIIASLLFYSFLKSSISSHTMKKELSILHPAAESFVRSLIITGLLGMVIFSSVTFLTAQDIQSAIRENITHFSHELTFDAQNSGNEICNRIINIGKDLTSLSKNKDIINMSEKYQDVMVSYYLNNKDKISSISRMSKDGIIVFTYPYTQSIGMNISNQPHVNMLLNTYKEVLSDPILSVQGFPAVIFHEPVFENGAFNGSIAALFNIKSPVLSNLIAAEHSPNENIIIATSDGTIIASEDESLLMTNISTLFPERVSSGSFVNTVFGRVFVVEISTRIFQDTYYKVYAFIPNLVLAQRIWKNVSREIILILLLIITALLFARELLNSFSAQSKEFKTIAIEEYTKAIALSNRLSSIANFFGEANVDEDVNKFFERLLLNALSIITGGDAGSVIIKENDKFVFKAAKGFDIEKLKRLYLTKKEIVISESKEPMIIKNIYDVMKEKIKEGIDKFEQIGNIKSTIQAPFIVNGEYYGGLFIGSFKLEDAFSEDDLKLAKAISNLGSFFIRDKLLIDTLKKTEDKIMYIISEFSKIDISMKEKEFFDNILKIGKYLIPAADGGSIILMQGEYFKYVSSSGFDEEILQGIAFKKGETFVTKRKDVSIIRNIVSYDEELPDSLRDALFKAGAGKIKQTLIAPIIVNDEYQGGIFLDSFTDAKVFTQEDLQLASALSKLSSVFIDSKLAYGKLSKISQFNDSSISLFHQTNLSINSGKVVRTAYDIIVRLYSGEIEEIAVSERRNKGIVLVKFNGEKLEVSPMSEPKSISKAIREKQSVYIENPLLSEKYSSDRQKSQVVVYSNIEDVPIVRIRFNKVKTFDSDERDFFDRFGHEIASIYLMITSFKKTKELLIGYILSIARAIDSKDPYTKGHSERVTYLSVFLAEKIKLDKKEIQKILIAGLLHDVGKIGIPEMILGKKGKLTEEEYEIVKQHPANGERIVEPLDPEIAKIIRHHHERWNGSGYPDGLKGEDIPFYSRILTVTDVFDAITSDRPYRKRFSFEEAYRIIKEGKGTQFDPEIVELFLSLPEETILKAMEKPDIQSLGEKYIS